MTTLDRYSAKTPGYRRPQCVVYLDLDGVLADYDSLAERLGYPPKSGAGKRHPGFYAMISPFPGAIEFVTTLEERFPGCVRFLTACSTDRPEGWSEKVQWIKANFPHMTSRLIITQDKSVCGSTYDVLVDDNPQWAGVTEFPGSVIPFKFSPSAYETTLAEVIRHMSFSAGTYR